MTEWLVVALVALPLCSALATGLAGAGPAAGRLNVACAGLVAAPAVALAVLALGDTRAPLAGRWWVVDPAGAVFLLVIAVVGLLSALASGPYLRTRAPDDGTAAPAHRAYHAGLYLFWAALLAVAVVDNLAIAWLLIEATTVASALLVAESGKATALEAGWKYLVLTTLGLTIALLGILLLYSGLATGHSSLAVLDWRSIHRGAAGLDHRAALLPIALIFGGLAAKIGWAPVHNWLPDAHSEAPAPVSALLSAALLPTVMLVAWRVEVAMRPAAHGATSGLFIAFGMLSLAIAVPFLWRPLPLKRLLAYSSLEHMGVIALGIGFAQPLATAGVVIHVCGHALAKSLGFYAAIAQQGGGPGSPRPPGRAPASPICAAAIFVSLASLSGLPPSPLFVSELLILLGGLAAGQTVVVVVAALLLALGFLGLAHALIEGVAGSRAAARGREEWWLAGFTAVIGVALLALAIAALALPHARAVGVLMDAVA